MIVLSTLCPPVLLRADGDNVDLARETYDEGQRRFDMGDYEGALLAFQESLEAFPHYRTIFNIALCQEKLGLIAESVEMYSRYRDWPTEVPNREAVAAKIEELRRQLPEEPEKPNGEEVGTAEGLEEPGPGDEDRDPVQAAEDAPSDERPGPDLRIPGWVAVGTGAAGIVTGGILLGLARSRLSEMRSVEDSGEIYDPGSHGDLPDEGEVFQNTGWIVGGVGLAVLGAGVGLLLLTPSRENEGRTAVSATVDFHVTTESALTELKVMF